MTLTRRAFTKNTLIGGAAVAATGGGVTAWFLSRDGGFATAFTVSHDASVYVHIASNHAMEIRVHDADTRAVLETFRIESVDELFALESAHVQFSEIAAPSSV